MQLYTTCTYTLYTLVCTLQLSNHGISRWHRGTVCGTSKLKKMFLEEPWRMKTPGSKPRADLVGTAAGLVDVLFASFRLSSMAVLTFLSSIQIGDKRLGKIKP